MLKVTVDAYEVLNAAVETLSASHPLAATLALRAMIDFTLTRARSSRYRHAVRHLGACARLASTVEHFGAFESHDVYEARLLQAQYPSMPLPLSLVPARPPIR